MARLSGLLALVLFPATISAQTVFVTTVSDVVDFTGAKKIANLPGPDGKVSMREACIAINNTGGAHTIGFQVPVGQWGTGVFGPEILNAGQPFPIDTDNTIVDGTTQTAFTGDLNPNGAEVSFRSTTTDVLLIVRGIFEIRADHCTFKGLGDMTNRNYGLDFLPTAEENLVIGCVIRGKFAAVRVQGDRNVIGGTTPALGNKLSSLSDGLRIQCFDPDVAQDNVAIGNVLTGEFNGVQIVGPCTNNRIGGFAPGEANLISGAGYLQEDNTPDGAMVRIETEAHGNLILGNLIGTDATGTLAADNVGDVGVEIYGDQNFVVGNVIGGITGLVGFLSVQAGISLREGAENNVIQGNFIGVDASGSIPIPNTVGIRISAFDSSLDMPGGNLIGGSGPGQGNVIRYNEAGGVVVLLDSTANRITRNVILDNHANGAIGIDLGGDGATPNDAGDGDTGPNLLMNAPVIVTSVSNASTGTVVTGRLDTPNPQSAEIEFYSNPAPGAGEIVEAANYLGSGSAASDGKFCVALPVNTAGLAITAIAIDALGNTSEISLEKISAPSPWINLGVGGVPGTGGLPLLSGAGTLAAGSEVGVSLTGCVPNAPVLLSAGLTQLNFPFFGGTFVPFPDMNFSMTTNAVGAASLVSTWPGGVATGNPIYVQAWIVDAGSAQGFAASHAIKGTFP